MTTDRKKLAITNRMFGVMRALANERDPYDGCQKKSQKTRVQQTLDRLAARRLIMHTNVVANPWRLTKDGAELLRLRDLGERRLEERSRRAFLA